ncbi:RagB/SusD family nutrient uptake outer membrane protein [Rapidithrix thailandica]|uniref:RagB/SusD family nutrient uptake outer membrane protein n=1 Tax=Rapidithrix thailandica TaxID=413964 RepID=A0AAW9S0U6_9BACT
MKNTIFKKALSNIAYLIVALGYFATSCSEGLLDKQPLNAISENDVFKDATFLQSYVYNAYNGMRPHWSPGTGGFIALTDLAIAQSETHNRASGIREYLEGNINPDNITALTDIWNYQYDYIRRVNIFFENTESSDIDPEALDPMKGEMHFLRAWMYFDLSRHFGGVPLITKSFTLNDASFDVSRNTYDEVAEFVLEECNKAIELLDGTSPSPGKISKAAAMGLKARMLLYMASPLNNPSNEQTKWEAAEAATKAVIDAGFTLHPTYEDLFLQPIKSDETIFAKSFTSETRIPDWGYNYDFWPSGFDARQRLNATQTFVNMFQMTNGEYPYLEDGITVNPASGYDPQNPNVNRDPRYYNAIVYPGAGPFTVNDGSKTTKRLYEYWEDANPNPDNQPPYQNPNQKDPNNGQDLFDFGRDSKTYWVKGLTPFHWRVQTGYTFKKLLDFSGPRASFDYDYNQMVVFMRLAEFYLNYAEIQIALGNEALAREYINKVRKRASVNMPDITSTGAELLREYRNERAVELHLEDARFFDLMRWKAAPGKIDLNPVRGLTKVTMDWTGAQEGDLLGTLHFTYGEITAADPRTPWPGDHYYRFPIPREEIKRSNNSIEQNPGYE